MVNKEHKWKLKDSHTSAGFNFQYLQGWFPKEEKILSTLGASQRKTEGSLNRNSPCPTPNLAWGMAQDPYPNKHSPTPLQTETYDEWISSLMAFHSTTPQLGYFHRARPSCPLPRCKLESESQRLCGCPRWAPPGWSSVMSLFPRASEIGAH